MTPEQQAGDHLATSFARMEGKFDVFAEKMGYMASGLQEIKDSNRDDRSANLAAMRDHILDLNPHPAQELWIRDVYHGIQTNLEGSAKALKSDLDGLSTRLIKLEAEQVSRRTIIALLAFLVPMLIAAAGLLAAFLR